ncbi:hypothetical protein [Coraliomargarita akajimensis]|uniref:Uncharacterized protein n=1 Tax=Coraliomargarita akajimensis (strain DSM 45221 / IAM 15411 / JCM 23193 / KCTC 12865 / 04OKA010-24) TaxID=583355 RepID=D5EJR3_CORAD|nr:hypothetical protein [Coraliomargarita akajimensis]ADE54662.1 hypothetical protein Caka_1643 [Coraliomargarita akajimensis DSM 45221]
MKQTRTVTRIPFRLIAIFGLSFGVLLHAEDPNKQLKENSPFLPEGHGKKTEPAKPVVTNGPVAKQLEFRGLMKLGGQYSFSLFDKRSNKGYWLKQGKSEDGIRIDSYDSKGMSVMVNFNGRSERLTLISASDAPMNVTVNRPSSKPTASNANKKPVIPPGLNTQNNSNGSTNKRVIPRRRVILPKK